MSKRPNPGDDKKERVIEIHEMLNSFCETYLNEELAGYAIKLCNKISKGKNINILRGKKEIWAASIIYVIARLNFLFDKKNEKYITTDIISDFFNANKSTIGNKATQIERFCNLTIGAAEYRSKEITDSFTFYQTPGGFIIPKRMIEGREIIFEAAEGEDEKEIESFIENKRIIMEQKAKEKRERRAEINREIARKKKAENRNKNQLNFLDDL